jgi:choline dehydrogenase-like flavoprotein
VECIQPASVVVVAGNGIGTARLLLASGLSRGQDDLLGKNLMVHPVAYVRGIFANELDGPAGPVGCLIVSHEFAETDRSRGFSRGIQIQITRENTLLAQAVRQSPNWGRAAQVSLAEEFRHSVAFMVMTEDLPEPSNRVRIGQETAADGLPDLAVDYRVSESVNAMLDFGIARAGQFFGAAGAVRTVEARLPPYTGWHLLGTARMGTSKHTSVTDARGRMHACPNIIIADGSVMPTAGCVNPTSTIGALALKFADDLAREFA